MSEHSEQLALFEWAKLAQKRWPELALMFAIPNGGKRPVGVGVKLKAEGVKPGVPDLALLVPRGGFSALLIELKFGENKLTDSQKWWHDELCKAGNLVRTCWGWEQARTEIEKYLRLGKVKGMIVEFQE